MRNKRTIILSCIILFLLIVPIVRVSAANIIMPDDEGKGIGNGSYEELCKYSFKENELKLTYTYYHSPNALLSYETVATVWTAADTNGNPTSVQYVRKNISNSDKYEESGGNTTTSIVTYSADFIISMMQQLYPEKTMADFANGTTTVYVSEIYQLKTRKDTSSAWVLSGNDITTLEGIRNAAEWSQATYDQFEAYYDIELQFRLSGGHLDVIYVDSVTGEQLRVREVGNFLAGEERTEEPPETLILPDGREYKFTKKYQLSYNDSLEESAWKSVSGTPFSYTPLGDGNCVLYVQFEEQEQVIVTPTPTITVTPTPTITPTPTVTPTPEPTPTPAPEVYAGYERHYTTSNGYSVTDYIHSTTEKLASESSSNAATIETVFGQYITKSYSIGTDGDGNQWYFIADTTGGTATYVHPYKYNGTTDITSITELVFPSTLNLYGKTYTVKSIGGAGNKYGNGTSGTSSATSYEYGISNGYYVWSLSTTSTTLTRYRSYDREYVLGVVGNGKIVSYGSSYESSDSYVSDRQYWNHYYFANTTLKKVTIPSSVTEICDYAFYQCQALTEITGGTGVTKIGNYAFYTGTNNYYLSDKQGSNYSYYYYNGSYSLTAATDTMKKWATQLVLPASLTLPALAKLETIGNYAFYYRYNLGDITFKENVTSIGNLAFAKARLNSVTFLNDETEIASGYETLSANQTVIHTKPYSTAFEYWTVNPAYYRIKAGYTLSYDANGGTGTMEAEVSEIQIEYAQVKESVLAKWTYSSSSRQRYFILDKEGILWRGDSKGSGSYSWTELVPGTKFTKIAGAQYSGGTKFYLYALDENGNLWRSICESSNTVGKLTQITSGTVYTTVSCAEGIMVCLDTNGKAYYMGSFYLDAYVRSDSLITYSVSSANALTALDNAAAFAEIEIGQRKVSFSVSDDSIDKTFTYFIALDKSGNIWGYGPSPNGEYGTTRNVTMKAYSGRTGSNSDWTDAANSWKQVTVGTRYTKIVGCQPTYYISKGYSAALDSNGYLWHTGITAKTWKKDMEAALTGTGKYAEIYRDGTASRVYYRVKDTNGDWWQGKLASASDEYLTFTKIENEESEYSYFDAYYLSFFGTAKENAYTRSGYKFTGWNTKADGSGTSYAVGDTFEMTGNVTLYAEWELVARIVYHANGGTGTMADTIPTSNSNILTVAANGFTKQGHTFNGWNTVRNGTGTSYQPGDKITVTEALNLYAQWKPYTYTVTYNGNGATEGSMSPSTHTYGESKRLTKNAYSRIYSVSYDYTVKTGSTTPVLPNGLTVANTRAEAAFKGWSKTSIGIVAYADEERVSNLTEKNGGNVTLYAVWELKSVTLPEITRAGYTFKGWNTKADGSGDSYAPGSTIVPTQNIKLYAQWTSNTYTVTFDWNFDWNEPGVDTHTNWTGNIKTVTFDATYGTLPEPTREGYEFLGWYMKEDLSGNGAGTIVNVETPVTTPKNHTLYARWSISYMESAEVWICALMYETVMVAEGEINLHPMREYGDTLLNVTVTTDGYFGYLQVNVPWTDPIVVEFEEGTFDKENDIWYLPNEDYMQLFPAGDKPDIVRNNPGYKNEEYLITVDFYRKDGTIITTYKVNIIFVPYDEWKKELHPGLMSQEDSQAQWEELQRIKGGR